MYQEWVAHFERQVLGHVLASTGGNLRKAAQQIGIPRVTLADKVRRLGLQVEDSRRAPVPRTAEFILRAHTTGQEWWVKEIGNQVELVSTETNIPEMVSGEDVAYLLRSGKYSLEAVR